MQFDLPNLFHGNSGLWLPLMICTSECIIMTQWTKLRPMQLTWTTLGVWQYILHYHMYCHLQMTCWSNSGIGTRAGLVLKYSKAIHTMWCKYLLIQRIIIPLRACLSIELLRYKLGLKVHMLVILQFDVYSYILKIAKFVTDLESSISCTQLYSECPYKRNKLCRLFLRRW